MPRTKVRKTGSTRGNKDDSDSVVRDFDRLANQRIRKTEADIQMQINSLASFVDVALSCLPMEIRKMTLGEFLAAEIVDNAENNMAPATEAPSAATSNVNGKTETKRDTAASDDGYATEGTSRTTRVSPTKTTRGSSARQATDTRSTSDTRNAQSSSDIRSDANQPISTRSSSRNRLTSNSEKANRKDFSKISSGPPKTNSSKFKTPSAKNSAPCFNAVTPKVKPNTPINILRRPRDGEMVLSMQGSPLLVSSIVQERTANVNVPLTDGNVISLLPNAGLRLSHMPDLDHETMQQLKTLKEHINMVIGSQ